MKADGLKIEILLGSGEKRDVREELKIDMAQLSMELQEQPSWYAYYASLLAEATMQFEEEKSQYDSLFAEVSSEIRSAGGARVVKITEKKVELDTDMDPRTKAGRKRMLSARRAMENLKVIVRAFEQRMDALKAIGHMESRQMEQDLSVKSKGKGNGSFHKEVPSKSPVDESLRYFSSNYMDELNLLRQEKGLLPTSLKGKR